MINLFQIPFIQLIVSDKQALDQCALEAKMVLASEGKPTPVGWLGNSIISNPQVLNRKSTKTLTDTFNYLVYEGIKAMQLEPERVVVGDSWLNKYEYGHFQEIHNHAAYSLSCIFYLDVPENCEPLVIYNPYRAQLMSPCPYDKPFHTINLESGLFIMMPSYVDHAVPTHLSNEPKISLAANIFYDRTDR